MFRALASAVVISASRRVSSIRAMRLPCAAVATAAATWAASRSRPGVDGTTKTRSPSTANRALRADDPLPEPRADDARERLGVEDDREPVRAGANGERTGKLHPREDAATRAVVVDRDRPLEVSARGRGGAARGRIGDRRRDRD